MVMHAIRLLVVLTMLCPGLATVASSAEDSDRAARVRRLADEWMTWLRTSDTVVLVSLIPHGEELGRLELSEPGQRRQISEALITAIVDGTSPAACFEPRHLVVATKDGKKLTFVICFQCNAVQVVFEGKEVATLAMTDRPAALFDQVLAKAGIALAPK